MEKLMLFLFLVHVNSQGPEFDYPEKTDKCNRPAELMYLHCCIFPPFFVRDIAKACGAMFEVSNIDNKNNVTVLKRIGNSRCNYWKCILDKYGLVNPDQTTLSHDKYYLHLEKWVEYNPDFTNVMHSAKMHCKNLYRMALPIKLCDFFSFHGCIRRFINTDCPATIPSKQCLEMKQFYEECREFYI